MTEGPEIKQLMEVKLVAGTTYILSCDFFHGDHFDHCYASLKALEDSIGEVGAQACVLKMLDSLNSLEGASILWSSCGKTFDDKIASDKANFPRAKGLKSSLEKLKRFLSENPMAAFDLAKVQERIAVHESILFEASRAICSHAVDLHLEAEKKTGIFNTAGGMQEMVIGKEQHQVRYSRTMRMM